MQKLSLPTERRHCKITEEVEEDLSHSSAEVLPTTSWADNTASEKPSEDVKANVENEDSEKKIDDHLLKVNERCQHSLRNRSVSDGEKYEDLAEPARLKKISTAKMKTYHSEERVPDITTPKVAKRSLDLDQAAIDNYYEKNQYTITGMFEKNQDTFHRLPEHMRRNRLASIAAVSQRSIRSHHGQTQSPYPTKSKFHKSFFWLAHNHKKYGLRHILLLLLVLFYTLLGATIFYLIEHNYEVQIVEYRVRKIHETINIISADLTEIINSHKSEVNESMMQTYIEDIYIKLLSAESIFVGSAIYKSIDPENRFKWTFGSSFFFSMNVFTTTGYGSIAPESSAGKACVIWYGFIFVPLTLVVIRDLGQWTLVHLTKIYGRLIMSLRASFGFQDTEKEDDIISLPIPFCMCLMAGYLLFATVFIYYYDEMSGPNGDGITFFHSFYFSFVSMSTIGLGDIMPNNVTFSPIITILFFFGMPVLKVVNRVTYVCVENGVFGTMTVLENRLDSFMTGNKPNPAIDNNEESGGAGKLSPQPSYRSRSVSNVHAPEIREHFCEDEDQIPNEWLNNMTVRSIATFMRSNADVYGGDFGRVNIRRGDLKSSNLDVRLPEFNTTTPKESVADPENNVPKAPNR